MNRALRAVLWIITFIIALQGLDYLTGDTIHLLRYWGEAANTQALWGSFCTATAVLATIGLLLKHEKLSVFAACLGAATWTMMGYQIADTQMFIWPPEGIRVVGYHLGNAAIWASIGVTIFYRSGVEKKKLELLEG